jgi:chemotaxis-related protein WspB
MLLLTFNAGANRYALDSRRVVELIPKVDLRAIPHAPPFFAGLLAYRGKVVPVIDLGVALANASCRVCLGTRIILVSDAPADQNRSNEDQDGSLKTAEPKSADEKPDPDLIGLLAENVSDLARIQPQQFVPVPVQMTKTPYLDAIVQTDQGILQLVAVDKLRCALLHGEFPRPGANSDTEFPEQEAANLESRGPEAG